MKLRVPNAHLLYAWISYLVVALMIGFIWRWEVEYHGWYGLIWIGYFHWAIPAGILIFLVWMNSIVRMDLVKRIVFNLVALALGYGIYYWTVVSHVHTYNAGPSGFVAFMMTPTALMRFYRFSVFIIPLSLPLIAYAVLRIFGQKVHWGFLLTGLLAQYFAALVSATILESLHHKGGYDYLHGIKSGVLFGLWALGTRIVVVGVAVARNRKLKKFT